MGCCENIRNLSRKIMYRRALDRTQWEHKILITEKKKPGTLNSYLNVFRL
jgi:hypothetical protein